MNILILNGSPRKGNTYQAINTLKDSIDKKHHVEIIETYKYNVGPCMACGLCKNSNGCVQNDDTNFVINKMVDSDLIVFASPVYWWGISAKMKLFIDKAYCKGSDLKNKKIGTIIIGADSVDTEQYKLIRGQFECISNYLNWDMMFNLDFSEEDIDDLKNDIEAIDKIKTIGINL